MNSKLSIKKRVEAIIFALVLALGLSFLATRNVNAAVKETPMHGKIIVKYSGRGKVHLLNEDGKYINKYTKNKSKWRLYAKATIKKRKMYRIGKNVWIPTKYAKRIKLKTAAKAPVQWNAKNSEKGFLMNTASTGEIVGDKSKKIFYLPTQKNRKIFSLNAILFDNKADAEKAGYKLAKA